MDARKNYPDELYIPYEVVDWSPRKTIRCIDKVDIKAYIVSVHLLDNISDKIMCTKYIKLKQPMVIKGKYLSENRSFYNREYYADQTIYNIYQDEEKRWLVSNATLSIIESEVKCHYDSYRSQVLAVEYDYIVLWEQEQENYSFSNAFKFDGEEIAELPKRELPKIVHAQGDDSGFIKIFLKIILYGFILYTAVMISRGIAIALGE